MSSILVTGGCSFSVEKNKCWPHHLEKYLNPEKAIHIGLSCQGNNLIGKKILYQLINLLNTVPSPELIVGIMWSSSDRKAVYLDNPSPDLPKLKDCLPNPTSIVEGEDKWYMLNSVDYIHHGLSRMYYENFHSVLGGQIDTCEEILRIQWFLQKYNIKYFMSTYTGNVLPKKIKTIPEVSYLYNQIAFDHFLPIDGQYDWCEKYYKSEFINNDWHPTPSQHEKFTNEIIIPFLKEKQYI